MKSSVRRAMVVAAIVAVTAASGAATASAQEPDGDNPSGDLTEQLSGADTLSEAIGGSSEEESTSDGDGDDNSGILLPGDQGRDLLGEEFTALSGRGIDELRAVTDNLTDPINEVVCELTDDELELLDLTRTDIQLLGDCPQAPAEDESDDKDDKDVDKPEDKPTEDESDDGDEQPDADNDDSHTVPTGGIETGAGGTAGSTGSAPAALGTLSMVAAGAVLAWRRRLGAPV